MVTRSRVPGVTGTRRVCVFVYDWDSTCTTASAIPTPFTSCIGMLVGIFGNHPCFILIVYICSASAVGAQFCLKLFADLYCPGVLNEAQHSTDPLVEVNYVTTIFGTSVSAAGRESQRAERSTRTVAITGVCLQEPGFLRSRGPDATQPCSINLEPS